MKKIGITFTFCSILLLLASCKPKMSGPVGDIFALEYYWELEAYLIRENPQPLTLADRYHFLSFPDNLNKRKEEFYFWDSKKKKTMSWQNQNISFDVDRHRTVGTYIKKTEDGKYFKAVVITERPAPSQTSEVKRLEISNLMDESYQNKNDTIRFIYKPIEKF